MPINKNTQFNNIEFEQAIGLCVKKYFNNREKTSFIKENFIQIFKKRIGNYNDYKHYYPLYLHWILTPECNIRCKHCLYNDKVVDKYDSCHDLSHDRAMQLIDEIGEMDIIRATLTGGEIFLREDIFEILSKLKSKNIIIALLTNATLITKEVAAKLKTILNSETDIFQISLDGATKETHEKTRGKNTFDRTIQGISYLINEGFFVQITCVATNYNVLELEKIYQLTRELNVVNLSIGKFIAVNKEQEYLIPDKDTLFKSIAKVLEYDNKKDKSYFRMETFSFYDFIEHNIAKNFIFKYVKNDSDKNNLSNKNYLCHHHDKISLASNGDVYLCPRAIDCDFDCLGNVKDMTLKKVWAKRHDSILFQERKLNKTACNNCEYFNNCCHGGCPLNAYQKYGDIQFPDKNCHLVTDN